MSLTEATQRVWFEFLLTPSLLKEHLSDPNPDPSPVELIVTFLCNSYTNGINSNGNSNNVKANEDSFSTAGPNSSTSQPMITNGSASESENNLLEKKVATLKLLAVKVGAFLRWDIDIFEKELPISIQFFLLKELLKIVDSSGPQECNVFGYIIYFRWVLRAIIRLSYPVKDPRTFYNHPSFAQKIDSSLQFDSLENLHKKLREMSSCVVSNLEKIVMDYRSNCISRISMPLIDCFPENAERDQPVKCYWDRVEPCDSDKLINTVLFELGKWYFFNENYSKSSEYFESVDKRFRNLFENLNSYLSTAKSMLDDKLVIEDCAIDFFSCFNECLDRIKTGNTYDLSFLERVVDLDLISKELKSYYRTCSPNEKQRIRKFAFYLTSKLNGLKELILDILYHDKITNQSSNENGPISMNVEEGEIDADFDEDNHLEPELELLESTSPEIIQELTSKINKPPLAINKRWEIPRTHMMCLKNCPRVLYNKCHIVLAKAAELRRAKMYLESRILYLSLLEDFQASLPDFAELITFELLHTDLKHHIESYDIDERRICDLLAKCERTVSDEQIVNELPNELIDLCCLFLMEAGSSVLKNLTNSKNPFIRLSALLTHIVSNDNNLKSQKSKEMWELLLTLFNTPNKRNCMNKRHGSLSNWSSSSFCKFLGKFKNRIDISVIGSCLVKIYNSKRDNSVLELSIWNIESVNVQWPNSIATSISANLCLQKIGSTLEFLVKRGLEIKPTDINLIKCKAELCVINGLFADAMRHYLFLMTITTEYFTVFGSYSDEDNVIQRMIHCSTKLGCHTQAAVLHQMTKQINYSLAFKCLSERFCNDSCDDLYECIWEVTFLEFLINLHTKRGENDRKQKTLSLIGQLELNANNSQDIALEAAHIRKAKFFRALAKRYLYIC